MNTENIIDKLNRLVSECDVTIEKQSKKFSDNFLFNFSWVIEDLYKNHYQRNYILKLLDIITATNTHKASDKEVFDFYIEQFTHKSLNFFNGTNIISNLQNMWEYQCEAEVIDILRTFKP